MRFPQGSTPTWYAAFTDDNMQLIDPDIINVDLFGSDGARVLDDGVPIQDAVGQYHFTGFEIPVDAPDGVWKIEWESVVGDAHSFGFEEFEVAPAGVTVIPSEVMLYGPLRSRLGEVGVNTMFEDPEIAEMLALHGFNLDAATLEGWQRKAAHLQHLIDFNESGTERNLSRKFIQAKQMVDFWYRKLAGAAEIRSVALAGRVVGVPVRLRGDTPSAPVLTGLGGMYERMWPLNRSFTLIPAVLQ